VTISRKTCILDSSAILRYLDRESGCERMRQILNSHADGSADVVVASVHWGEVAFNLIKRNGESVQPSIMAGLF
jgi:predicted nucleic acid-binding protein